jgi:hypothetical protein
MVPGMTRGAAVMAAAMGVVVGVVGAVLTAGPALAEPDPPAPAVPVPAAPGAPAIAPVAVVDPGAVPPGAEAPPAPDANVVSSPPNTTTSPDGWTLTVSAKDETQMAVAPLTTAISTREFEVGGVYNGSLSGGDGETPKGVFEVGYQIGCGIDMSTSNGVSMTGTAGLNPSIGFIGLDFTDLPVEGLVPGLGANIGGGITVGLKPGIVNTVPVTKKQFESTDPWVSISKFRIKIDGCVGQAFIRSYAILAKSDKSGDAILSWYGASKAF